jgi:hypothetical protein
MRLKYNRETEKLEITTESKHFDQTEAVSIRDLKFFISKCKTNPNQEFKVVRT